MALIKCPECGKDISDKSEVCIGCGFPLAQHIKEQSEKKKNDEIEMSKFKCKKCFKQNDVGTDYCVYCGYRLTPIERNSTRKAQSDCHTQTPITPQKKVFTGIYRYSYITGKEEVYCPQCHSENCSWHYEKKVVPGKTKTRYTANLNPLRPFTLVNKKEKVVRKDYEYTEKKIICNSCGYIFQ